MRHKRSLPLVAAIALTLGLALPIPVLGQTPGAGAELGYAGKMRAAAQAFERGVFSEALGLYQQAHALKPSARTLRGIGRAQFELRLYVAAAATLLEALMDTRSPLAGDQRAATADLLARASAAIAQVQLRLTPADAVLTIDRVPVALPASGDLRLDPGQHVFAASAPDYESHTLELELASGTNEVVLALQPVAPKPVASVSSEPASAAVAPAPQERSNSRKRARRGLMITGATLGGLGLIGASVTGGLALAHGDELNGACPADACPPDRADDLERARGLAMASNVLWGVTGLGAGLLLVGILLPRRSDDQRASTPTLRVTPSGLSLRGNF